MTNRGHLRRLALRCGLIVTLLCLFLPLLAAYAGPAAPFGDANGVDTVRHVAPGGDCKGATPCYATLQSAVDAAVDGDLIKIAAGTYTDVHERSGTSQVVHITKGVILRGGYSVDNGFADPPRPDLHPTILDAQSNGRVVVIAQASPTLEGLVITGGDGYYSGGGIAAEGGAAIITRCDIVDNHARGDGAGLFINRGSVQVIDSRILRNHANWGGGLRIINDAEAQLIGNRIAENVAQVGPGGIDIACCGGSTPLVLRNLVVANQAGGKGGGLGVSGTNAEITNNIFVGNEATEGAGIWLDGTGSYPANVTLTHNTIVAAATVVHGVWTGDYVTALLTNNMIVDFASGIHNSSPADSTVTARRTLFYGNASDYGAGIASWVETHGDPLFVAPGSGDFHIRRLSAAIDRGRVTGVTEDIDGQPRPLGSAPDLGADEYCRPIYLPLLPRLG